MSMEFLILQGNTQSLSKINYEKAITAIERREVQSQITDVTEMFQDFEDSVEEKYATKSSNAKSFYDLSIQQFQIPVTNAKEIQAETKTVWDEATTNLTTAQANVTSLEGQLASMEAGKNSSSDQIIDQDTYDKLKQQLAEAKDKLSQAQTAEAKAKQLYDNATTNVQSEMSQNELNQKNALMNYQEQVKNIEAEKKSELSEMNRMKKSNLNALNQRDARLELTLNDLNTMAEMLKAEKDSAKESVEQKAQDLAPKYG